MSKWAAHIYIKWNKDAPATKGWEWLANWKEVKGAWSTMGEWDMTLWVEAATPNELEDFVHNKLRETDWIENTCCIWVKEVWWPQNK